MRDCKCGKPVRLSVVRVNLRNPHRAGVAHFIVHVDGSGDCGNLAGFDACMMKPYPKDPADRAYGRMVDRWEAQK